MGLQLARALPVYALTHRTLGEVRLAHLPPCAPCGRRECPLGHHACMEDLAVDDVFREVERVVVGEWAIDTAATGGGRAGGRPGGAR